MAQARLTVSSEPTVYDAITRTIQGTYFLGGRAEHDAQDAVTDGGFLLIAAPHAAMTLRAADAGYVASRHSAPLRGGDADLCGHE